MTVCVRFWGKGWKNKPKWEDRKNLRALDEYLELSLGRYTIEALIKTAGQVSPDMIYSETYRAFQISDNLSKSLVGLPPKASDYRAQA